MASPKETSSERSLAGRISTEEIVTPPWQTAQMAEATVEIYGARDAT
jgi:hypothetical protein